MGKVNVGPCGAEGGVLFLGHTCIGKKMNAVGFPIHHEETPPSTVLIELISAT